MYPICRFRVHTHSLIPLINQIHHHLHHHIFLLGAALGNHQREGHEGVVRQALGAVGAVEDAVVVQEPKEQGGFTPLTCKKCTLFSFSSSPSLKTLIT